MIPSKFYSNKSFAIIALVLIFITFLTSYYGSTDLGDYSDTARYFAGEYNADIRSSHSYLYGFLHAPFMNLFDSYIIFKITSLIFLFAIVYSVYCLSNRDKRAILLMLLSPVVWYMAPWINPIQLASLCLLWAHHFIRRHDETHLPKYAAYAGILVGLGLAFWDTIIFFGAFLFIAYMWDKKFSHSVVVFACILIGLSPRLALDYYLFNFPFFSLLKSFFGTLTNAFFLGRGTSYAGGIVVNLALFILIIISLPLYFFRMLSNRDFVRQNKKSIIFLAMSLALILINPQIRYTLAIVPIMSIILMNNISEDNFRRQITASLIISLIFISPYLVQTFAHFNNSDYYDITAVISSIPDVSITRNSETSLLQADLREIGKDYPNQKLLVIGHADYYQKLAHIYWGSDIDEFVSVQDYELWRKNETTLFEKRLEFYPRINDRRAIWVGGGIMRNTANEADYPNIRYALSLDNSTYSGFSEERKYSVITLLRLS